MSFGSAFGAFASGAASGTALGKGFMDSKAAKAASTIAGNSDGGGGKTVGFGLGQDLVSGKVGASTTAADASAPSGPWAVLSGILGNLGGDAAIQ